MIAQNEIECSVGYGLSPIESYCKARIPLHRARGAKARQLAMDVLTMPQSPGGASRTQEVLLRNMRVNKRLSVQVLERPNDAQSPTKRCGLDDIVVPDREEIESTPAVQRIAMRLSEPYRGG